MSATGNNLTAPDLDEYCNERFEFCVTYPNDYFSERVYADNGDGLTLFARDRTVEIDITGAYNVMNWSVQDIVDHYFKTVQEKPMEVELLELYTDEAYGWAKMKYNYEIQLLQINLLNDAYVTTLMTVPTSEESLLEELQKTVQLTFPV